MTRKSEKCRVSESEKKNTKSVDLSLVSMLSKRKNKRPMRGDMGLQ